MEPEPQTIATRAAADETAAHSRVLVVDDERSMRELLAIVLRREGYDVRLAENGTRAIEILQKEPIDLLISDIKMPDMSGVEVLRTAKRVDEEIVGIMITAHATTDTAVEALRLGALDYLYKPFSVDELKIKVRKALKGRQLERENELLRRALQTTSRFSNIIGPSDAMQAVFRLVERIAPTSSTVLISGESGTGKELVARAIHFNSLRRDSSFVAVNCGALPETLLESELFGHMRGAFTDASSNKKGLIEAADKGTVFLDEIGEMSPMMQVKLLRVLQERRFRRLGGVEELSADIRIIAATNRDLSRLVADGRFREDLFYRINVIPVHLPPLRDRAGDVLPLAEHFVRKFSVQMGKRITGISEAASACLLAYSWPGNVRELENAMERAVALEPTVVIQAESLPEAVQGERAPPPQPVPAAPAEDALPPTGFDLEKHVQDIERDFIVQALRRAGGVKVRAADLLGMSFRSFRYYMKKYNL